MPTLTIPMPRLLPVTSAALAALLAFKTVDVVRSFMPGSDGHVASGLVLPAEAAAPPAHPAPEKPAEKPADKPAEKTAAKPADKAAEKPAPAAPEGGKQAAEAAAPADPPVSDSERALLQDLRARRVELEAREKALAAREQVLAAAEQKLTARVDELSQLQARLEQLETARKQRDEGNWQGLVKMYESMKPRDAATIFNDLDTPVLLEVLDRMKEAKAAPILAAMQPDRAREATTKLAQKRTSANTVGAGAANTTGG
jgi:flagellar motility protein MotE (MotC chaperone)